jgi:nitrite reductase/ring-hydroxylating ferredoxin subunit/uncharacterized membrane protein
MRTKASIKGHPIHPMLIAFPIAFLTGAFVADAAGWLLDREMLWTFGAYLAAAGIITGLAAAVPGFIDYVWTVPPRSSGKKRATVHMAVNVTTILLFALAWWVRGEAAARPGLEVLAMEAAGVILLTVGGWLGGTLVYRNFVGPEHRYAGAGKWNEESYEEPADGAAPIKVAGHDELAPNQMKLVRIGDRRIVIARTEDGYAAFDDHCTHSGGSLAGGVMICGTVQCLWHGSQFDVRSGQVKSGPAKERIGVYPVEVRDGEVWVAIRGEGAVGARARE